jgi:hypothetical protein
MNTTRKLIIAFVVALAFATAMFGSSTASAGSQYSSGGCCGVSVTDYIWFNSQVCQGAESYAFTSIENTWSRNNTSRTFQDGAFVRADIFGNDGCAQNGVNLTFSTGYAPFSGSGLDSDHNWPLNWPYISAVGLGQDVAGSSAAANVWYGSTLLGNACTSVTMPGFTAYPHGC